MRSGSIKKALEVRDAEKEYIEINKIFENLEKIDIIDLISSKEKIFSSKENIENILNYINLLFFNKTKENIEYAECMKIVEDTKDRLNRNNNFDMTIDNFLMTVWEEVNGKYYRS